MWRYCRHNFKTLNHQFDDRLNLTKNFCRTFGERTAASAIYSLGRSNLCFAQSPDYVFAGIVVVALLLFLVVQ